MENRDRGPVITPASAERLALSREAFNKDDSVRFQRNRRIRGLAHELFHETVAREVRRRCEVVDTRPLRILDIGCGSGPWIEAILDYVATLPIQPNLEIRGVDAAERLVECARDRLVNRDDVELECRTVQELEYRRKFDVIYLVDVLQHIAKADYPSVFAKLSTLLGSEGAAVIIDKERYSLFALRMMLKRLTGNVPDYYRSASYPSFSGLRRLAGRKGLHPRRHFRKRQFGVLVLNKPA